MKKPTLLILAAGMGSRYGGLKQIDKIGPSGEAIIDYSIYDAIRAGFGKVVFVIRKELEQDFRDFFGKKLHGKIDMEFVYQEIGNVPDGIEISADRKKPWGTGHAILVARDVINEPFAVINADDFYGADAYRAVADYFHSNTNEKDQAMVGYQLNGTLSEYGTVSRGVCKTDENGFLQKIEEITNIGIKNGNIGYEDGAGSWKPLTGKEIVSMNIWGFYPGMFRVFSEGFGRFIQIAKDDPKAEYFIAWPLTDMLKSESGRVKVLETNSNWFGVTYREDKSGAVEKIRQLVETGHYPHNLWQ
jgi:choline kinase